MKHDCTILLQLLLLAACTRIPAPDHLCPTTIVFSDGEPVTRALDPDQERISDLNLLIFNHGLNDNIIEALKLVFLKENDVKNITNMLFFPTGRGLIMNMLFCLICLPF